MRPAVRSCTGSHKTCRVTCDCRYSKIYSRSRASANWFPPKWRYREEACRAVYDSNPFNAQSNDDVSICPSCPLIRIGSTPLYKSAKSYGTGW
ncbi:hypothetical protein ABIC78_002287 [Novosphingobium sp. 1529]